MEDLTPEQQFELKMRNMKPRGPPVKEEEYADSEDSLSWAEGYYDHNFKLPTINDELDVPPVNQHVSKMQARELAK